MCRRVLSLPVGQALDWPRRLWVFERLLDFVKSRRMFVFLRICVQFGVCTNVQLGTLSGYPKVSVGTIPSSGTCLNGLNGLSGLS